MKTHHHSKRAFTIVEIMMVVVLIGILSVGMFVGYRSTLKNKAVAAEQTLLAELANEIQRTFPINDWNLNISAINGYPESMGGSSVSTLTVFGSATPTDSTGLAFTVPLQHWAAKISRGRGDDLSVSASSTYEMSLNQNASLRQVAVNRFDQPRWLIAGPINEPSQRYILISLVAIPEMGLVIPAPPANPAAFKLWFDAIWGATWSADSLPPASWASSLSPGDYNVWIHGEGKTTNCDRLVVKTITQHKYSVTLNQNAVNTDANVRVRGTVNALISTSASGSFTSASDVLAGRWLDAEARSTGSGLPYSTMQSQLATGPIIFTLQN